MREHRERTNYAAARAVTAEPSGSEAQVDAAARAVMAELSGSEAQA
ncbi:hypothetical protein GCM10027088_07600 [Nocardia goodfellowii]